MKAVVYRGKCDVRVEEAPDPTIEHPADAIIRVTTTNICGSDLHMYEGRSSVEDGKILGHENMGIVEEVGPAVFWIEKGDRVSVPFNIACGVCRNCNAGWTSFCLNTNPQEGVDGAAYGYANMGYMPEDPGASNEPAKAGRIPWQYGQFFTNGQRMGTGQCPVKRYNRELRDLIVAGKAKPGFIVSHELPLDEAPRGYDCFDKRVDGWTKVLLHPHGTGA